MLDGQMSETELIAKREAYLKSLYGSAISSEEGSSESLEKLSLIALGGNDLARVLIEKIDKQKVKVIK